MSAAKEPERERSRPSDRTAMDEGFLRAFVAIARTLSQSLSLEAILNTTLELTLADPRVEAGEIYLLNEKSGELSYACHRGLSEECVQEAKEVPIKLGEGVTGYVAAQKEPMVVPELSEEPRFLREMPQKEGYRSLISLPIKSGDRVYAVINLFARDGKRLSPRYVGWLAASMEMLGIAFGYVQLVEALKQSEERYRCLVEDINDGYVVIDIQEGRIVFANAKMAQILGYQTEELVGAEYHKLMAPELIADTHELRRTIAQGGALPERYEAQGVRKDGTKVYLEVSMKAVDYEGEPAAAVIVRDITERKRAEEAIIQQAERLAVTAALTRIMVSSLNIEEVFGGFAAGVRRLLDASQISINIVEGDKVRVFAVSSDVEEVKGGDLLPLEGSADEWVLKNERTLIEADLAQARQFAIDEILFKEGLRSAIRIPLFSRSEVFGTFNLFSRHSNAYGEREVEILEELAGQIAVAIQNDALFAEVKQSKEELERAYDQLMVGAKALDKGKQELEEAYLSMARTLVLTLEVRDPYTRGHSDRVAQLCRQMALEIGVSREDARKIETAARLHDLGKIGIPDAILLRPGPITPSERAEIQLHPTKAVELLRFLGFLDGVLPVIEGHHERYNGGGYPDSLQGEETPLGARILAVADAYDAMTSARPYRPPMTSDEAIAVLKEGAGTQWDPEVVEAFLRTFGE